MQAPRRTTGRAIEQHPPKEIPSTVGRAEFNSSERSGNISIYFFGAEVLTILDLADDVGGPNNAPADLLCLPFGHAGQRWYCFFLRLWLYPIYGSSNFWTQATCLIEPEKRLLAQIAAYVCIIPIIKHAITALHIWPLKGFPLQNLINEISDHNQTQSP